MAKMNNLWLLLVWKVTQILTALNTPKTRICKRPPSLANEEVFLCNLKNNPKGFTIWAMFVIQVDLKHKYSIIGFMCFAANAHHRAKQNSWCFVKCNQKRCIALEALLQRWHSLAQCEKKKCLVPLRVKNLSQERNFKPLRNNAIKQLLMHTDWYDHQYELSLNMTVFIIIMINGRLILIDETLLDWFLIESA